MAMALHQTSPWVIHSHWGSRPIQVTTLQVTAEPASCPIVFTPSKQLKRNPPWAVHRQGASERKPCFRSILRTSASSGGRIQWPFETLCDRKASARQALKILKGKLTCLALAGECCSYTCLRIWRPKSVWTRDDKTLPSACARRQRKCHQPMAVMTSSSICLSCAVAPQWVIEFGFEGI